MEARTSRSVLKLVHGDSKGAIHPGSPQERRLAATAEDLSRALSALRGALDASGHLSIGSEIQRVFDDLEKVQDRTIDDLGRALADRAARQHIWSRRAERP